MMVQSHQAPKNRKRVKTDERVYLLHADMVSYDQYGRNPDAQILKAMWLSVTKEHACFVIALIFIKNLILLEPSDM